MTAETPEPAAKVSPLSPRKLETTTWKNKVCFFQISDFVEDRVRVRGLNIGALVLVYIYFVLALLKTVPRPEPQVKSVRFATPPPASWLSGELGDDLKSFYTGLGSIPNRSQKIFVINDARGPMPNVDVEVRVSNFVADGPLMCSKAQMDAMANTVEARRLQHVCRYDNVQYNRGKTDSAGLITLSNFTIDGPGGLYTLQPSAGGVDSPQESIMLVSTPVASLEVVDDTSPDLPPVPAPLIVKVGETFALQPRILVRDMRGLPVPGRKIIAFANPDSSWPITGPSAQTPDYERRGQKVVELSCPESELSDDLGIARFTCLGVSSANVDHVNIVFAESGLVFAPWNDDVYSPRSNYPVTIQSYRYSTYVSPRIARVQVTTPVPSVAVEGVPFDPQPAVTVTGADGVPVAGVTCYALVSMEMGNRNPNWYRRQVEGVKSKELLDAVAITDSNGVAQFSSLRWSVEGNTMDLILLKHWGAATSVSSVSFNCDGVNQDTHAWNPTSGSYMQHVEPSVAEIRIKRFIRSSAEVARYLGPSKADGSDIFVAVVRVVNSQGKGIPGKTVAVEYSPDPAYPLGNINLELRDGSVERTNDLGFAVVAFQMVTASPVLELTGSMSFKVRFLLDGVRSAPSQWLTARIVGGIKPQVCHFVETPQAEFYSLARRVNVPLTGYPNTINSGDVFFAVLQLKSATSCVTFPSVSTPNASDLIGKCELPPAPQVADDDRRRLMESNEPPARKLQSADGSIQVEVQSVYSTVTDKYGKVRFEPSMLDVGISPIMQLPTIREYNNAPHAFPFSSIFSGQSGDHWVRIAVTTTEPDGTKQTCYSRPVPMRVENAIGDIEVIGDGGEGSLYNTEIEAGGSIDIDLRMLLDPAFVDPTNLSLIPSCLHLGVQFYAPCAVTYVFRNAPYTYHRILGLINDPMAQDNFQSDFHKISPVQKTSTTNGDGFDPVTGMLHLRFQLLKPGIYGKFGIQFSGFGVRSRIFTFRVKPPPGLRFEVVQEPGWTVNRPLVGHLFDVQPAIRVLSDNGPVNGLIATYELLPEAGAKFEKLTRVDLFSAYAFLYSLESGITGNNAWGSSLGPQEDGLMYFNVMGVIDGSGCTRFRFVADGVASAVVPQTPICLERPWNYAIVQQPPSTWPLNLELQEFGGIITVEMRPRFEIPHMAQFTGGLLVRLRISSEGGKDVDDDISMELSQRLLGDAVCLFNNAAEALQRCSNMEVVQVAPFPVLRFSFLRVNWVRRISNPAKIKLRVSDMSGSNGWSQGWPLPNNFYNLTAAEQFAQCTTVSAFAREVIDEEVTSEITAETSASQYKVLLAPPDTVVVGSMFLVRVQVSTASGGPVRDARVRAGIKALKSMAPGSTSPGLLQSLAVQGNSLGVVADQNVELDPLTVTRVSDANGVIGFPLTVTRGSSGTYQLQFQPDVPDAHIVLQTSAFKVQNSISVNASSTFSQIEIAEFGKSVTVPQAPEFCIESASGESLQTLEAEGIKISMTLTLKGAPNDRESMASRLVQDARKAAVDNAKQRANSMAQRFAQTPNSELKKSVDVLIASANSKRKGMFAGLSEEFAEACTNTPANLLQSGDPAMVLQSTFGNLSAEGLVGEQAASLAEALGVDPSALDATQSLNQFADILMSAGSNLQPAHELAIEGKWELALSDLDPQDGCYKVNRSLQFNFKEGMRYAFAISVNGVEATQDPFQVKLAPADPVNLFVNWFMSFLAAIVAVILLISNVTQHHWTWFLFSLLATIGLCIALPFMTLHQDAMYGSWLYFALANFLLIAAALAWGLFVQLTQSSTTFARQRQDVFEEYSQRKMGELLKFQTSLDLAPQTSALRQTFLKPFNSQDAFFFPSAFLIASFLSFMSFIYILFQSIQVLNGLQEFLEQLLNTAVDRSVAFTSSINNAYFQAVGADLPDSSTDFMYVQINVMRDWFQKFINSIIIGFTTGIVVAATLTILALIGGFYHFRQSVMDARVGKFGFKKKDAKLVFSTAYIGINISSSIVSYILIVALVTLVTLPFTFELTWRVIWTYLGTILLTFVLPRVIKFVSMKCLKKCIFGPTFIKSRAGSSIFHFYMTFLALPGGVVTAITRFVFGLLGVLVMLPITYGCNQPSMVNSVTLLDSSYRTYIAFVMLYATHNNPIMIAAAQRMLQIKAQRAKFQQEKKHWTSTKSILLLILIRFPQLRECRKHVLEEERKANLDARKPSKGSSDSGTMSEVKVLPEEKPKKSSPPEPWIAHVVEEATQKARLMKKYQVILQGLEPGTEAYESTKSKLRDLCRPHPLLAGVNEEVLPERTEENTEPDVLSA